LDIVEGSALSEMEIEIAHRVGAGNVGALATQDSFALTGGKKKKIFG
jgi:molybdopterin-binding protein